VESLRALGVFPHEREVRLVERDPPRLVSPTDVRLRVLDVGVCGTDREICRFEFGTPPPGADHLVLGHECLAEVLETGPAVHAIAAGDLVVPAVRRPCPHDACAPCRSGRQDFCHTGDFVEHGIKGRHGFLTDEVVEDARYLHVVPRALRDVAVLVEPLTVVEKALAQVRQVQDRLGDERAGRTAVVAGAGPVGLLSAMALAAAGFETTVWSQEPEVDPRAELMATAGVRYVPAVRASLRQLGARPGNIDVLFEATGAPPVAFEALEALGHNGVLVLFGLPGARSALEVDAAAVVRTLVLRNQLVLGTINAGREDFEAAIADLSVFETSWPGLLRRLVTGRSPMEDHAALLHGPARGIKNVIAVG
jgi:threonine dehydrogenase-like Zn-dependent dehydrogenase